MEVETEIKVLMLLSQMVMNINQTEDLSAEKFSLILSETASKIDDLYLYRGIKDVQDDN